MKILACLLLASCAGAGVTPGDILPDYIEFTGGATSASTTSARPLFDGIESDGTVLLVTLGWELTQPEPIDMTPVVNAIMRLRDQLANDVPYGPALPTGGLPSLEVTEPPGPIPYWSTLTEAMGPIATGIFAFIVGLLILFGIYRRFTKGDDKNQGD